LVIEKKSVTAHGNMNVKRIILIFCVSYINGQKNQCLLDINVHPGRFTAVA